jgi:hypothetical protein
MTMGFQKHRHGTARPKIACFRHGTASTAQNLPKLRKGTEKHKKHESTPAQRNFFKFSQKEAVTFAKNNLISYNHWLLTSVPKVVSRE